MSIALVNAVSGALARRTDRRGFLSRTAMAGTAAVVAPAKFLLEPVSAYAAVCSCSGSACDCASRCCDGYTEFCCTITGSNSCPAGTLAAGWWKADAPGLCGDAPRYYIDCNVIPGQNPCSCGCANGNCGNRKACCTNFRYGQCHQELPTVGAIMCRVVTCTPPWLLDPTCTTAVRTDNNTRFHDAACLHEEPPPWVGMRTARWYLADQPATGIANREFGFGDPRDIPVVGDWNGDGRTTPGVFRGGQWFLSNTFGGGADIAFGFGQPGDLPIVGRWVQGDPRHYPGVIRGATWYLATSYSHGGVASSTFRFGDPGDIAVIGDWDGDGRDGIGVVRQGRWFLRNQPNDGPVDVSFTFGDPGDVPVPGRWLGPDDERHLPGVRRGNRWYLRHSLTSGVADVTYHYGDLADLPLVGDWDADGADTIGVAR